MLWSLLNFFWTFCHFYCDLSFFFLKFFKFERFEFLNKRIDDFWFNLSCTSILGLFRFSKLISILWVYMLHIHLILKMKIGLFFIFIILDIWLKLKYWIIKKWSWLSVWTIQSLSKNVVITKNNIKELLKKIGIKEFYQL